MNARERRLRRLVEQAHDAFRFFERQGPQQHGVDDAEHRGVRAKSERKHANHREGERRSAGENPDAVSDVSNQCAKH